MKQQRDLAALIDPTLTPQTARKRGLVWVCDLFAEMLTKQEPLLADLLHEGFQLGKPSPQSRYETIGLYQPQQQESPPDGETLCQQGAGHAADQAHERDEEDGHKTTQQQTVEVGEAN